MNLQYDEVLKFASEKHSGQYRADGVTPYINHPVLVAELVKKYKQSKNIDSIVAAALLHDTLEDTYTSYRELVDNFGEMVASMVMEVTSASFMPFLAGKADYLQNKMINMSNYALIIKLADRLANIIDGKTLTKERREKLILDTNEIVKGLEQNRKLTSAQANLIKTLKDEVKKLSAKK